MSHRSYFVLPVIGVVLSIASQAAADVAPPTTYVEECTVEKKQTATTECLTCKASRAGDSANRCTALLSPYCYTHSCNTWGGTAYTEIWCRSAGSNAPVLPDSIKSQLSVYGAPNLDGTAGAPNCSASPPPPATGGSTGTSTAATGGSSSGAGGSNTAVGGSNTATGGTPATTTETAAAGSTAGNPGSDSGCSLSPAMSASGSASLGLMGLLGLCWFTVGRRRRS